jgi:hypothetical protein
MKLLAIIPLGFAGFFACASANLWHDFFWPDVTGMRVLTFGVAWLTSVAAIATVLISAAIIKYVPWRTS